MTVPDTESYQELFAQPDLTKEHEFILSDTQPRLHYALEQMSSPWATSPFMLLKAPEEAEYLTLLGDAMRQLQPKTNAVFGGQYHIAGRDVTYEPATQADGQFAAKGEVITANWVEAEQLFGCLRQFNGDVSLQPGLVHRANGGVLLISLRTLLAQPLLWMRLKTVVTQQRFDWVGYDDSRPLPVSIPSMPLSLTVVLTGDRESLADFREMEPELAEQAVYSEFEDNIQIADADDMAQWCQWVMAVAERFALPSPAEDAWPGLIREAVRYTGDQETLPLCPLWIGKQLREVGLSAVTVRLPVSSLARCWPSVNGVKVILLTVCRMKFCWNRFWWRPKANVSGKSTPCPSSSSPDTRAPLVSLPVSAVSYTLVTANLPISNARPNWAEAFMPKA